MNWRIFWYVKTKEIIKGKWYLVDDLLRINNVEFLEGYLIVIKTLLSID